MLETKGKMGFDYLVVKNSFRFFLFANKFYWYWNIGVGIDKLKRKLAKNITSDFKVAYYWVSALILSACGGGKSTGTEEIKVIGFSPNYVPPKSNFDQKICRSKF